jgi:putative hydrolase of the HAD superfamily
LYFHKHYNCQGKTLDEVEFVFRQVDLMCNAINEQTEKNIDADEMYLMVISLINQNQLPLHEVDIRELFEQMDNLLFENLPLVYCNRTANTLSKIKQKENTTINILSNTGFICGSTLRRVLKELHIDHYFDFQLYSDEVGLSKPNKAFFQLVFDQVSKLKPISLNEIIHIGDNPKTDYEGARSFGIHALLVNSTDTNITHLLNHEPQDIFTA